MTAPVPQRKLGKNAFFFAILTVAIDMLSFGLIIPVMPSLVGELAGLPPEQAVPYGGYLSAVYASLNFVAAPALGSLSDRFGRRPVLLVSMAMLGIDFCVMGFAHSLEMLFVGRMLSGVSGATFATCNAYIADVTEPDERGAAYGKLGAAFGIGFVLGPVVGGLLGHIDARAPFFAAAALSGVNFLYGWFVLPESLPEEDRRPFSWKRANPFGALVRFASVPQIGWLVACLGVFNLAQMVFPATWGFHGEIRYGWTPADIGWSLGLVGVTTAIVQVALLGKILKKLGQVRAALVGILVAAVCYVAYAFASRSWMPFVIIPIGAFTGLATPAITSIVTALTPRNAQGELQGGIASIQSLGNIVSPLVMTQTLFWFSRPDAPVHFHGAAFLLAAILNVVAIPALLLGVKNRSVPPPTSAPVGAPGG